MLCASSRIRRAPGSCRAPRSRRNHRRFSAMSNIVSPKVARENHQIFGTVPCDQGVDRHQGISFIHGGEDVKNVGLDTKIRAGAGALALTLLLAACATGPAYVRPSVDVPPAFKERPAGASGEPPLCAAAE